MPPTTRAIGEAVFPPLLVGGCLVGALVALAATGTAARAVDKSRCTCECWDGASKHNIPSPDYDGYRVFWFNSEPRGAVLLLGLVRSRSIAWQSTAFISASRRFPVERREGGEEGQGRKGREVSDPKHVTPTLRGRVAARRAIHGRGSGGG